MTHTPGPWRAERQDDEDGHIYWAVHSDVDYEFVVNVHEETLHSAADARLIAAAPALLASLKRVMELLDAGVLVRDITKDTNPDWGMEMMGLVRDLTEWQSAIAKASAA